MDLYIKFRELLSIATMAYPCVVSIFFTTMKVFFRRERNYQNETFDYILNIFIISSGIIISGLALNHRNIKMEITSIIYCLLLACLFIYELHLLLKYERENKEP